jgi:hypothetical protein
LLKLLKLKGPDGIWRHHTDNLLNDFRKFGVKPRTDRAVRYEVRLYERSTTENWIGSVLNMFSPFKQPGEFLFGDQPEQADNGYIIDFPEKKLALLVSIDINKERRHVEKYRMNHSKN